MIVVVKVLRKFHDNNLKGISEKAMIFSLKEYLRNPKECPLLKFKIIASKVIPKKNYNNSFKYSSRKSMIIAQKFSFRNS